MSSPEELREITRAALRWAGAAITDELVTIEGPPGPAGPPGAPAPDLTPALLNLLTETRALTERITIVEADVQIIKGALAGQPGNPIAPGPGPGVPPISPIIPPDGAYSLLGNPSFNASTDLTAPQQTEYTKLWEDINSATTATYITNTLNAELFNYARGFHTWISSLLHCFRVTHDLALLDVIDTHMNALKAKQVVGWLSCSQDPGRHPYKMWVMACGTSHTNQGEDRRIDDTKVHALVAVVAYALDANRALASPGGRNYAASADAWKAYLLTDQDGYLAKVGAKYGGGNGFEFLTPSSDFHHWWSYLKLSHYLHKLGGPLGWGANATRTASIIWNPTSGGGSNYSGDHGEVRSYEIEGATALAWMSNCHWASAGRNYLQSTSYAGSNFSDAVDFYFEGLADWAAVGRMEAFAHTVKVGYFRKADGSRFGAASDVISNGVAGDIGGNSPNYKVARAGIIADPETGNNPNRRTAQVASAYGTWGVAAWDASGEVEAVTRVLRDAFRGAVDTVRLSGALFLHSFFN